MQNRSGIFGYEGDTYLKAILTVLTLSLILLIESEYRSYKEKNTSSDFSIGAAIFYIKIFTAAGLWLSNTWLRGGCAHHGFFDTMLDGAMIGMNPRVARYFTSNRLIVSSITGTMVGLRMFGRLLRHHGHSHHHAHDAEQKVASPPYGTTLPGVKTFDQRLVAIGYEGTIPKPFICRVTRGIMDNPVVLDSGYHVDLLSAQDILESENKKCPVSKIPVKTYLPNVELREEIRQFVVQQEKEFKERQAATQYPGRFYVSKPGTFVSHYHSVKQGIAEAKSTDSYNEVITQIETDKVTLRQGLHQLADIAAENPSGKFILDAVKNCQKTVTATDRFNDLVTNEIVNAQSHLIHPTI
jgi:hypothetical protein